MGRRYIGMVLAAGLALSLGACISAFTPASDGFKAKGKTMAVIAGLDNEPNVQTAKSMAESLRAYTRYQVMPHSQVKQAIAGYPVAIQGPYKTAYFDIEVDYTKTDMKKVRSLQQQLGVDYLLVLWTPSATTYSGKVHSLNVIGQLFESGREAGTARFNATAGRSTCCLSPTPEAGDKTNAIKEATDYVAKEIGEKTGMAK